MNIEKNKIAKMDIGNTYIDITLYGFKEPSFDEKTESDLVAIADSIFKRRKPYLYHRMLWAFIQSSIQIVNYAREINNDQSIMAHPFALYDSIFTTKQIVHVANGGKINGIAQSNFKWLKSNEFNNRKTTNPAHWLAERELILLNPVTEGFTQGEAYRYSITTKGVWVYIYLRDELRILDNIYRKELEGVRT